MKRTIKNWILTGTAGLIIALLFATSSYSIETAIGDDVDSLELRSIIVESWEKDVWQTSVNPSAPQANIEARLVKGKPKNLLQDTGNKNSFAIRFEFVYGREGNIVELFPPETKTTTRLMDQLDEENNRKTYTVPGIELPGKVKAVSVWVLGRGNEYNLEGWIEDWKGDTHIYQFGSIDFVGWRPMTVVIPDNVPQDVDSYPQTKTLVFKKFVLRSTHRTSNESVVVFFDSLKVLTDVFDVYFDGADMDFDEKDAEEKARLRKYEEQLKKAATGDGSSE